MSHLFSGRAVLTVLFLAIGAGGAVVYWMYKDNPKPDDGPKPFRDAALESGINFQMTFLSTEQGKDFKINLYDHGCGVAIGDYDGDGHDDIYFCNQLGKNALYRNKGDGTFEDVTEQTGVGLGDRVCVAATWADTRNCGLPDLYVTSTRGGNVLFRNDGHGKFTDVTKEAGLEPEKPTHSQTAVFFDFDNDGYLDLLVTNTAEWTTSQRDENHHFAGPKNFWDMVHSKIEHNVLYRNKGNGNFELVKDSGLEGTGWGGDVAVFDYDHDGKLDVLITNMFGASQLYHNEGKGKFSNVTKKVLGKTSWGAIGAKALSVKNDGRLDLFITDMHSDMWLPSDLDPRKSGDKLNVKYTHFKGPFWQDIKEDGEFNEERAAREFNIKYDEIYFGNTLFKAQDDGTFKEISDDAGMETFWPWGIATGDFDNDGFEDVFIPSGMGHPYYYWPNTLMMNNGNGKFTNKAKEYGLDPPPDGETGDQVLSKKPNALPTAHSSRCAAVADFDGDGRLDLVVNNFNNRAYYYRNNFPKKNYIAFRLTGTKCNKDAIGALVKLHIGNEVMVRQVQAAGGYLSQSTKMVHFGLGDRKAIEKIEVIWPGTTEAQAQVIEDREINKLHTIEQK